MKVDIIGGGIIGMSTAYHLAVQNVDVTVFEKDKRFDVASFGRSCGGTRCQFFTKENILLSQYSISFIKNQTSVDFTPNGYLMLFGEDQQEDHRHSTKLQQELGATTKTLTPVELKELYPWITVDDVYRACYTDDGSEGWIDPYSLHTWFKDEAKKLGIKFVWEDGIQQHDCDAIVIAAGCWTGEVAKKWNIDIPVKGQKHTVYNILTETEHIPTMPLVADLITGVYWRPEGEGYIVGYEGNSEWDSEDLEPNWDKWEETWQLLYHRSPSLFEGVKTNSAWAGYYDTNIIDSNAIIDHVDNIYFATGFTGRGLMQSPAVGLSLSNMILGETPKFNLDNYKLDRKPLIEKYVI
jgi:glycine/D-amino acid oxidase-like deaminating enzyme